MGKLFSDEQLAYITSPDFDLFGYYTRFPKDSGRSLEGIARARRRYRTEESSVLYPRPDNPQVEWDKKESSFHWRDAIPVLKAQQEMARAMCASQSRARIRVHSSVKVPVIFLSDFHIGSWGTDLEQVDRLMTLITKHGLYMAWLGDMAQMSIRLRGVLEFMDNKMTAWQQDRVITSLFNDVAPDVLWATWDNHVVQRQEDGIGFSPYANMLQERTIYHNGIGHIDLDVGTEDDGFQTYKIASSHRFRGRSSSDPVAAQKKYMRTVGIDRELAIAGDSHDPALSQYVDGEMTRIAINCGTLQIESDFAERFFGLDTHDWMPVVEFCAHEHRMIGHTSLTNYLETKGLS